jgi:hypothetical protein
MSRVDSALVGLPVSIIVRIETARVVQRFFQQDSWAVVDIVTLRPWVVPEEAVELAAVRIVQEIVDALVVIGAFTDFGSERAATLVAMSHLLPLSRKGGVTIKTYTMIRPKCQ